MSRPLEEVIASLRRDPASTSVLVDFDGTLAPIVDDPTAALPLPGVASVLTELAQHYRTVAVISGRPVAFLLRHLGPGPVLSGLYGLERMRAGLVERAPEAEGWEAVVDEAAAAALAELPDGVGVENKDLSLTLHVRTRPALAEPVERWTAGAVERWGLSRRGARMSFELHPPLALDKGTIATELIAGSETACFIGDDVGDLPAFAALERFGADGGSAHRIVVSSPELVPEMTAAADVLVDGPAAVLDLLRALLPGSE